MERWEFDILKERKATEYFIDTKGRVRKWKGSLRGLDNYASTHFAIAEALHPENQYPDDLLHDLGWIAIGSVAYGKRVKDTPTNAQIKTMRKLGFRYIRDSVGILYNLEELIKNIK